MYGQVTPFLCSALKDIHSFSSLRRSTHSGSRVSFGQSVVTEYTPPSSSGESSRDEPGSSHSASDSLLGVSLELEPIEEGEDEEEDEEEEERGGKKEEEEGGSEGGKREELCKCPNCTPDSSCSGYWE